ncbi:hypothetical protein Hanom_Chr07g00651461 [Helianthus anomalus]
MLCGKENNNVINRPINESNIHELFVNLFGGKFVYLINERTRTKNFVRLIT